MWGDHKGTRCPRIWHFDISHEARRRLFFVRTGEQAVRGAARRDVGGRCDAPGRVCVPQQAGLGRGLAAILPASAAGGDGPDADPSARTRGGGRRVNARRATDLAAERRDDANRASRSSTARSTRSSSSSTSRTPRSCSKSAGLGRQVFCAGRRPLGPDDEELLVVAARALHAARARAPRLRPLADAVAVRARAAPRRAALRRLARPAHRSLRPAQLRPPARDGDRAQQPVRLAVHAGACSTSTTSRQINDQRGSPGRRRGAARARRAVPAGAALRRQRGPHRRRRVRDDPARTPNPTLVPVLLERVRSAPTASNARARLLVRCRAVPARGRRSSTSSSASPTRGCTKRRSVS